MERAILQYAFDRSNVPTWECPNCGSASLSDINNTFASFVRYPIDTDHPNFEPEWIEYVFTMTLECAVPNCKRIVACCGSGGVEQAFNEDGTPGNGWEDYFKPKYFQPALNIFIPPENTPHLIKRELSDSFGLFFSSPRAALNGLRIALEVLLNELGVPSVNTNGKFIPLDQRIDLLDAKYTVIVAPAKAIKWMGNDGSHAGTGITSNHVLDAYAIFEHVLDQIYPKGNATLDNLIAKINANKGVGSAT